MLRRMILAIGLTATLSMGSASAQDALDRAKSKGELTVATEMQYPPYDFLKEGKHVGYNADLFAEIGKELGLKIAFVDLPWSGVLPGLEGRKYDFVAGPATVTAERLKRYRFSAPIDRIGHLMVKRKGDSAIAKPGDAAGKPVGSQRGAAALKLLEAYSASLPTPIDIKQYVSMTQAYADLEAGRLSAVADASSIGQWVVAQRPDTFETVMPYFGSDNLILSFVGRKDADSASLIDAIDAAILRIKSDGRLNKVHEKWFGVGVDLPDTVPVLTE